MAPTLLVLALFASASSESRNVFRVYFFVATAVLAAAVIILSMRPFGWRKWPKADAVVTADPVRSYSSISSALHRLVIAYSYNFNGRLYTGNYRESLQSAWINDVEKRFPKGRTFVVRVKPGRPEVSIMRDDDQPDGILQRLERADEERKQKAM